MKYKLHQNHLLDSEKMEENSQNEFPHHCRLFVQSVTLSIALLNIIYHYIFDIFLSQSFFHNLSFTFFLSQPFFYNLSFTISFLNLCKIWDASLYPRVLVFISLPIKIRWTQVQDQRPGTSAGFTDVHECGYVNKIFFLTSF